MPPASPTPKPEAPQVSSSETHPAPKKAKSSKGKASFFSRKKKKEPHELEEVKGESTIEATKALVAEPLESVVSRLKTDVEKGLSLDEVKKRQEEGGFNEIPEEKTNPVIQYLKFMWNPLSWAMEVAAILSIVFLDYLDFGLIVGLLFLNATLGFWEEHNAGNAIAALKEQLVATVSVKRDGQWGTTEAKNLVVGDIVREKIGEVISADLKIIEGYSIKVDQSALTGESLPVDKENGDVVFAGSGVKQGECSAIVVATGADTFFGKSAALLQVKSQGHFQEVLKHIGFFCISFIIVFVTIELLIEFLVRHEQCKSLDNCPVIHNMLVLITGGVPIAMPTVLSITMALGAAQLSIHKAITSRLSAVEELAAMDMLVSDKTGTLTSNKLTVGDPIAVPSSSLENVGKYATLCSSADEDADLIDKAIRKYSLETLKVETAACKTVKYEPYNPTSKKSTAQIEEGGEIYWVTKGAPQIVWSLVTNQSEAPEIPKKIEEFAASGYRTLAVAKAADGPEPLQWKIEGLIPLSDPPREDTAATIAQLYKQGVAVKMITGDQQAIAIEIARRIGMGTNILKAEELRKLDKNHERLSILLSSCDGFAEVLPEDKFMIVEALQKEGHIIGMTGDGVNDAPALKKADIGIAVSGATSAARAASDIVLLAPGLGVINTAILRSRIIFQRMKSYSTYAVSITVRIVLTFFLLTMIFNYFFPPVLILILAITNDGTMLAISKDRVRPSPGPEKWNLFEVFGVASAIAVYLTGCTLLLFSLARETQMFESWFHLRELNDQELRGLIYLNVSITGFAALLVVRTQRFFWEMRPSWFLIGALIISQTVATIIAVYGFNGYPNERLGFRGIGWAWALAVWIWSVLWVLPMDLVKIAARKVLAPLHWKFSEAVHKFLPPVSTLRSHMETHILARDYHLKPHIKQSGAPATMKSPVTSPGIMKSPVTSPGKHTETPLVTPL